MSKWVGYSLVPKHSHLPNKPCVYALYFDGVLSYVGQTNGLSNRFSGHAIRYGYGQELITPWGDFPKTTKITVKAKFSERYGDWAMWEIRLIHRLKPVLNTHHKNKRRTA